MYERVEDESIQAFYKLNAEWLPVTPPDVLQFVESIERTTGLPRAQEEYPVDLAVVRGAAEAAAKAADKCFSFRLRIDDSDPTQLDRLIDGHLIEPALRPFLAAMHREPTEAEAEQYAAAFDELRVPREPLLYYALGAFWGEWRVRHRQACWSLYAPLRPVQSFFDMITAGPTICAMPFSGVCKKFADPEGDNLAFKTQAGASDKRHLPPFPLLASFVDADEAVRQLLPEVARRGMDADEEGDMEKAYELYCEAANDNDEIPQLLSRIISVSWQLEKWEMVDGVSRRLLELVPNHPTTCHNLAVLYAGNPEYLDEAIDLLDRALAAAPHYSRAHLTLASCLRERGDLEESREHAQWVVENDDELKDEAADFLRELNS